MNRNRFLHRFVNTNGPGDQRPTALDIIEDEGLIGKWTDKVALITGASSGIGIETARALQATGAKVFVTGRNREKTQKVVDEIMEKAGKNGQQIELIEMDNESLESVRKAAQEFLSKSDKLNILIANAGVMATPEGRTKDGFETQFGTNHLAHFLLFQLLKDTILKSATPEFPSRVVAVSSMGHRAGGIRFDNLNFDPQGSGAYNEWSAYGQSKTANIYFASYIHRHYGAQNLHAMALHPGGISTGLQVHVPEALRSVWEQNDEIRKGMKSVEQGAATTVWGAVAKVLQGKGRLWLENCQTCGPQPEVPGNFDIGFAPHAFDEEAEDRLWEVSNSLVGLTKA
ncbi:putative short-chain dehydrogenase [Rhizodiscina lignyota]|uniref:Short-chain dehydrogenase n=1 Tax=Rhizodiscina lignyota TaxID=1504668 RepID=A0A9P4M555_9PEZI|nr:putative short-chain dehydrogenase [Rhizodiscina lignyota]